MLKGRRRRERALSMVPSPGALDRRPRRPRSGDRQLSSDLDNVTLIPLLERMRSDLLGVLCQ
jgi:hypothetical protein